MSRTAADRGGLALDLLVLLAAIATLVLLEESRIRGVAGRLVRDVEQFLARRSVRAAAPRPADPPTTDPT